MFGQLCVVLEPLPGLGVVGAVVDGDALVDGEAPTSGDTVGAGEVAAWATTKVPNPPASPTPAATTIRANGARNHPGLFIALITSMATMRWPIATGSSMGIATFQIDDEFVRTSLYKGVRIGSSR